MRTTTRTVILGILAAAFSVALFACATTASFPTKHPVQVEGMPLCSQCHTDWRANLDHVQDYIKRHRFYAAQRAATCELCHARSFCSDCHANKEELKPSDKFKDEPERTMPHRGDYLTQHQIDGKLDPASCIVCHGRQNNERCKTCHR